MSIVETEVLIIGGGILGAFVARELSKYDVDTTLVEKEVDFGMGVTRRCYHKVRQGAFVQEFVEGDLRSKLCWDSMPSTESIYKELDVPLLEHGQLRVFSNEQERLSALDNTETGKKIFAKGLMPDIMKDSWQYIDRETLHKMEPNLNKKFIGAYYDPLHACTDSVRLTLALIKNAQRNGVKVMRGTEVLAISQKGHEFMVKTNQDSIKCRYIVNAAGTYADEVARMANADDFVLRPLELYAAVLDKKLAGLVNHDVMVTGDNYVTPSVHGNPWFGPPAYPGQRRHYHSTKQNWAEEGLRRAQDICPDISPKDIITSYCGICFFRDLEINWHDGVIEVSRWVPRFITCQVGFPAVSCGPASATYVVDLLAREGLKLVENTSFDPYEKAQPVFNELPEEEKRKLIEQDPRYGHVVCRCETVTEGEIVEAIRRGARTIDGVKFRCRPGMGRCHGGFCGPRVMKILARELGVPLEQITKKNPESPQILHKSKELLVRQGGNEVETARG